MKLLLTTIIGLLIVILIGWYCKQAHTEVIPASDSPGQMITARMRLDSLLDAIELVESGGDANAVGDGGDAIGAYQLHKIYIDDLNRIYSFNATYEDRWDREKSRFLVEAYLMHWVQIASEKGCDMQYLEALARIHNGGPNGWKKECTKPYWQKVKARLQ